MRNVAIMIRGLWLACLLGIVATPALAQPQPSVEIRLGVEGFRYCPGEECAETPVAFSNFEVQIDVWLPRDDGPVWMDRWAAKVVAPDGYTHLETEILHAGVDTEAEALDLSVELEEPLRVDRCATLAVLTFGAYSGEPASEQFYLTGSSHSPFLGQPGRMSLPVWRDAQALQYLESSASARVSQVKLVEQLATCPTNHCGYMAPIIYLVGPDAGSQYAAGDTLELRWSNTEDYIPKIAVSYDDGWTWSTIARPEPGTRDAFWVIPSNAPSTNYARIDMPTYGCNYPSERFTIVGGGVSTTSRSWGDVRSKFGP